MASWALDALNTLNTAIAVIGPDKKLVFSNPAFVALFGGDPGADDLCECIGAADQAETSAPRQIRVRDGRVLCIEATRLPDGLLLLTAEDVTQSVSEKAHSAAMARTDPLTGLGNRLMFCERLSELLSTFDAGTEMAAVLILNLDRFKTINETLGRPLGDALLRLAADRLRSVLRRGDIVARLGGDEFGVIQTGQPEPQSAAALAKRLVDLLGRSYIVEGHLLNIGVSVGVALIPADGSDHDQCLRNAGLALYRAKQDGRSTYCFFEAAMDEKMQTRRSLEIDLRRALAMRELTLVYQPQLNLASKQITGFEALLRWNSSKRGLVSPAEFIPLAEEIGLIVAIGEWVIRTACREAAGWPAPLNVAINVSAVQFGSPNLVPTIRSALAENGLDPRRLELEITESVLLGDQSAALDVLRQVHAKGIRIAMDDFGTGYSSLSYLRRFPFDKIKVDQSFVRGNPDDPSGMAIVRAIAALGRSLGMTATAEGAETEEQLARVAAEGCTDVQGYIISRPLPPERIRDFLQSRAHRGAAPGNA